VSGRIAAALEAALPGRVRRGVPLAPFSSYKVGGAAEYFVEPLTEAEVAAAIRTAREHALPLFVLGGGTNVLIREGGVRGMVLRLGRTFRTAEAHGTEVRAGAVAPMSAAALAAERASLEGLEFGYDIPGTVGGALRMNAGAHGGEIRNVVKEVHGVDLEGNPVRTAAAEIRFAYRTAVYPVEMILLTGIFTLRPGDPEVLAARRREYHEYRLRTQPKGNSVGSVFVNPAGDHAGRLIEAAGLKGFRIGGAVVSLKHANWILNEGDATAADIEGVIRHVQSTVRERFGVDLRTEVRIVGEPEPRGAVR
jgi:UDP-N-acetylmuramate dehydrogenase